MMTATPRVDFELRDLTERLAMGPMVEPLSDEDEQVIANWESRAARLGFTVTTTRTVSGVTVIAERPRRDV